MKDSESKETPVVRVGEKFSDAFNRFQDRVRERAYHLSLDRDQSDSMADWLEAQSELSRPILLEVKEQKKNIVVEANLKGFAPEEIEIEVAGDVLSAFGSHSQTRQSTKGKSQQLASSTISFFQSVPLPAAVDVEGSYAKLFKNGKLKITLLKKAVKK